MGFDIAQELVAARGRLTSDSDREVFDRALEAAQTEPDAVRAMLECALSAASSSPPFYGLLNITKGTP